MDSYNDFMPSKDHASGFPHVVIHKDNNIIPYSGDRSEADIINWFKKNSPAKQLVGGGKKTTKRRTAPDRFRPNKLCRNVL